MQGDAATRRASLGIGSSRYELSLAMGASLRRKSIPIDRRPESAALRELLILLLAGLHSLDHVA
jgi:hypothetical protein